MISSGLNGGGMIGPDGMTIGGGGGGGGGDIIVDEEKIAALLPGNVDKLILNESAQIDVNNGNLQHINYLVMQANENLPAEIGMNKGNISNVRDITMMEPYGPDDEKIKSVLNMNHGEIINAEIEVTDLKGLHEIEFAEKNEEKKIDPKLVMGKGEIKEMYKLTMAEKKEDDEIGPIINCGEGRIIDPKDFIFRKWDPLEEVDPCSMLNTHLVTFNGHGTKITNVSDITMFSGPERKNASTDENGDVVWSDPPEGQADEGGNIIGCVQIDENKKVADDALKEATDCRAMCDAKIGALTLAGGALALKVAEGAFMEWGSEGIKLGGEGIESRLLKVGVNTLDEFGAKFEGTCSAAAMEVAGEAGEAGVVLSDAGVVLNTAENVAQTTFNVASDIGEGAAACVSTVGNLASNLVGETYHVASSFVDGIGHLFSHHHKSNTNDHHTTTQKGEMRLVSNDNEGDNAELYIELDRTIPGNNKRKFTIALPADESINQAEAIVFQVEQLGINNAFWPGQTQIRGLIDFKPGETFEEQYKKTLFAQQTMRLPAQGTLEKDLIFEIGSVSSGPDDGEKLFQVHITKNTATDTAQFNTILLLNNNVLQTIPRPEIGETPRHILRLQEGKDNDEPGKIWMDLTVNDGNEGVEDVLTIQTNIHTNENIEMVMPRPDPDGIPEEIIPLKIRDTANQQILEVRTAKDGSDKVQVFTPLHTNDLTVGGTLTLNGLDVNGNLNVTGDTDTNNLTVGGTLTLDGGLEIKGNFGIDGDLNVTGATMTQNLGIAGQIESDVYINGVTDCKDNIVTHKYVKHYFYHARPTAEPQETFGIYNDQNQYVMAVKRGAESSQDDIKMGINVRCKRGLEMGENNDQATYSNKRLKINGIYQVQGQPNPDPTMDAPWEDRAALGIEAMNCPESKGSDDSFMWTYPLSVSNAKFINKQGNVVRQMIQTPLVDSLLPYGWDNNDTWLCIAHTSSVRDNEGIGHLNNTERIPEVPGLQQWGLPLDMSYYEIPHDQSNLPVYPRPEKWPTNKFETYGNPLFTDTNMALTSYPRAMIRSKTMGKLDLNGVPDIREHEHMFLFRFRFGWMNENQTIATQFYKDALVTLPPQYNNDNPTNYINPWCAEWTLLVTPDYDQGNFNIALSLINASVTVSSREVKQSYEHEEYDFWAENMDENSNGLLWNEAHKRTDDMQDTPVIFNTNFSKDADMHIYAVNHFRVYPEQDSKFEILNPRNNDEHFGYFTLPASTDKWSSTNLDEPIIVPKSSQWAIRCIDGAAWNTLKITVHMKDYYPQLIDTYPNKTYTFHAGNKFADEQPFSHTIPFTSATLFQDKYFNTHVEVFQQDTYHPQKKINVEFTEKHYAQQIFK